jgi:hypothetical protein
MEEKIFISNNMFTKIIGRVVRLLVVVTSENWKNITHCGDDDDDDDGQDTEEPQ